MSKEKVIAKAKKLMAMAADTSSPHEAAIAAKAVRALIDKYQLNLADLKEAEFTAVGIDSAQRQRIPMWEQHIICAVAKLNDCIANRSSGDAVYQGFTEDVLVSQFMLHYIVEAGKRGCNTYVKGRKGRNGGQFKIAFGDAICIKIGAIIRERRGITLSNGTGLMVIKQQLVEAEFGVTTHKSSKIVIKKNAGYLAGYKSGDAVNIVTGVTSNTSNKAIVNN